MNKEKNFAGTGLEQLTDDLLTELPEQADHVLFTIINFQHHENNHEISNNLTRDQQYVNLRKIP